MEVKKKFGHVLEVIGTWFNDGGDFFREKGRNFKGSENNEIHKDQNLATSNNSSKSKSEAISSKYMNYSLLDGYFRKYGISTNLGIVCLIRKIQFDVEIAMLNHIEQSIDTHQLNNAFELFKKSDYLKEVIEEFPYRENEKEFLTSDIINDLMKKYSCENASANSLYDKCVFIIEAAKKVKIDDVIASYEKIITQIIEAKKDTEKYFQDDLLSKIHHRYKIMEIENRYFNQ